MIGVGQWAFDTVRKNRVQVIERNELWGYVSYKVYDPVDGNIYQIAHYLMSWIKGIVLKLYKIYNISARLKTPGQRYVFKI